MERHIDHKTEPRLKRASLLTAGEHHRLTQEISELKAEQQAFLERYVALEEQNATLITLYVACRQLHSTLNRAEVLLAAREIISNLIGCEEYAVFSTVPAGLLRCVDSFGIRPDECERVCLSTEALWRVIQMGEPYIPQAGSGARSGTEGRISACIPLKLGGTVTGAIALFRLLPQKPGIEKRDEELFQLLENHLAMALHCTELHARCARKAGVEA